MKNKRVKQMMATVFNGEWETIDKNFHILVVLEGYFGSWPVHCALHGRASLTADQLRGK